MNPNDVIPHYIPYIIFFFSRQCIISISVTLFYTILLMENLQITEADFSSQNWLNVREALITLFSYIKRL